MPPAPGFIYIETFPWLMAAAQAIPGVEVGTFYRAFCHKNDINVARQISAY
jgi:hypothetical protein